MDLESEFAKSRMDMAAASEPDRRERKRKWDSGPLSPPPEAAAAAAAVAASSLNRRLVPVAADNPFREYEINDHPGRRFAMMSANIRMVESKHSVVIVSKGRYIPPSEPAPPADAPDHERKLFLKIRGESMESVDEAVSEIEGIMAQRGGDVKIWADMDVLSVPHLDIVERLRGVEGEYLKFIEEETGATVVVSGRGSSGDYSGRDNLHLLVKGEPGNVQHAKGLCFSLVKTVRTVYDEYRQRYYGVTPRRQHGSGRWLTTARAFSGDAQAAVDTPPPPPPPPPAEMGGVCTAANDAPNTAPFNGPPLPPPPLPPPPPPPPSM